MKIKQTIKTLFISTLLMAGVVVAMMPTAYADCDPSKSQCCGDVATSIISCDQNNTGTDLHDNGIWGILMMAINILSVGVGIAAIGGLVWGSVLWTSAGGDPGQVKKAREIITNVVIGLVAFALMYAFLNFIVPGGVF